MKKVNPKILIEKEEMDRLDLFKVLIEYFNDRYTVKIPESECDESEPIGSLKWTYVSSEDILDAPSVIPDLFSQRIQYL